MRGRLNHQNAYASGDFDVVRHDGNFADLHDGVLGDLLGVIGGGLSLKDQTRVPQLQTQAANPTEQPTLHPFFDLLNVHGAVFTLFWS